MGKTVSQLTLRSIEPLDEEKDNRSQPRLSEDSQALIGLKLRELYDDVVAEPVPERILDLLGKLGEDEDNKAE